MNIKQIIVPIDFSPHSAAALRWAALWQAKSGAFVTVLHCRNYEAPPTFTLDQVDALARQAARSENSVRHEVSEFIKKQLGKMPDWEILVKEGDPVHLISEACSCADMIIMGTHGRHGLKRWMLGSVAEAMLLTAKIPVMVVHQSDSPIQLSRLLVAINGSERDALALAQAADVARTFTAEIYSVHVAESASAAALEIAKNNTLVHIERSGKAAEEILLTAQEISADVLMLAVTHKRFLDIGTLPNVISKLLQYGTMPALLLPPDMKGIEV